MSTSKHPKGLYLIFATSTAERFSYYGMRAIFILFLTQALLFDKEHAASIYGSYTGLVYLTPFCVLGSHNDGGGTVSDVLQRIHVGCRPTVALADVWRPYLSYIRERMFQADSVLPRGATV